MKSRMFTTLVLLVVSLMFVSAPAMAHDRSGKHPESDELVLYILAGTAGAVGGTMLASHLVGTPPRHYDWFLVRTEPEEFAGLTLGPMLGATLAMGVMGGSLHGGEAVWRGVMGSLAGGFAGSVVGAPLWVLNPDTIPYLVGIGSVLGGTMAIMSTDLGKGTSMQVLPTRGGAYASYGFSF